MTGLPADRGLFGPILGEFPFPKDAEIRWYSAREAISTMTSTSLFARTGEAAGSVIRSPVAQLSRSVACLRGFHAPKNQSIYMASSARLCHIFASHHLFALPEVDGSTNSILLPIRAFWRP